MRTHLFQSPFEHWLVGLLIELAVFGLFIAATFILVAVLVTVL